MKHDSISTASIVCSILFMLLPLSGLAQTNSSTDAQIRTYMTEAQADLRAKRPDLAAQAYNQVLTLDPKNMEARANLGVIAMSAHDWAEAAKDFNAVLTLHPSESKAQALLGLCEIHLGQTGEAQKLLSEAFPKLEEQKLRREVGMMLLQLDFESEEFDKASAILASLQQTDPDDATVFYAAFRVYSEMAYRAIESLAINSPDSAELHSALAERLVNDGRIDTAITEFRKALLLTPDVPGLHFELGVAIVGQSHEAASLAEAQREFETSLRLNPANARCECELAEVDLLRTNSAEASLHFAQALKIDPQSACAKAGLAAQLIDEGKEQQALEYMQAAVLGDPYNEKYHYHLAALYRQMGDKEGAAKEMAAFKGLKDVQDELKQALHPELKPE